MRDESPMDVARALQIAQETCAALVAAHQAQVIHYDVKPHNVMLTPDGRVKVVDFGIAGFTQRAFTLAHSSQLAPAGTPEYGAPEQFPTVVAAHVPGGVVTEASGTGGAAVVLGRRPAPALLCPAVARARRRAAIRVQVRTAGVSPTLSKRA
ncbi:protein kinase [Streptomyces sp. NPDC056891]|uniref:protein kinase domain-containing protein n=1 Tax=unclassified Streptomyces TaxID=2593676 RepID=UPI0036B5C8C7